MGTGLGCPAWDREMGTELGHPTWDGDVGTMGRKPMWDPDVGLGTQGCLRASQHGMEMGTEGQGLGT